MEFRKGYFYRSGNTAEKWGERVAKELKAARFEVKSYKTQDCFNQWPKDSYFSAIVELA